jgi:hypothetical protein
LMCVMTRLISGHCVQNLLRRGNEKVPNISNI